MPGQEQRFPFRFTRAYRVAALPFGITPRTTMLTVTDDELRVRFGLWRLRTPRSNIADVEQTGGFVFVKTAGPAHLSLADHGVTFATNADRAVCIRFHEPVRVLDPTGRLRHPGLTVTVQDTTGLATKLRGRGPRRTRG